jgi:hypothetical protein
MKIKHSCKISFQHKNDMILQYVLLASLAIWKSMEPEYKIIHCYQEIIIPVQSEFINIFVGTTYTHFQA